MLGVGFWKNLLFEVTDLDFALHDNSFVILYGYIEYYNINRYVYKYNSFELIMKRNEIMANTRMCIVYVLYIFRINCDL